ncbi:MAG TPA: hypothetical protein VD905_16405, partial [Flavobacteriales bacterium]|nr:hypothetical protein [Flavobacteriales bacterium]
ATGINGHYNLPWLVIVLCTLFFTCAVIFIRKKIFRTMAGAWLIWFMGSVGFVFPFIMDLIYRSTHQQMECIDHIMTVTYREPAIHGWISNNWDTIGYLNVVLVTVLVIFLIIPMAIKWQSNPEE